MINKKNTSKNKKKKRKIRSDFKCQMMKDKSKHLKRKEITAGYVKKKKEWKMNINGIEFAAK